MNNLRHFTFLSVAIASVVAVRGATAQDWPNRPVTMVVPFAAGSASDTMARILSVRLSEVLGQQVVIENVSGAGGMTGVARVAKSAPDGY
jgi:tripartite-type tricarboxylate transporter receptor subunit TctC